MRRALALVFSNPADIELELAAAIDSSTRTKTAMLPAVPI